MKRALALIAFGTIASCLLPSVDLREQAINGGAGGNGSPLGGAAAQATAGKSGLGGSTDGGVDGEDGGAKSGGGMSTGGAEGGGANGGSTSTSGAPNGGGAGAGAGTTSAGAGGSSAGAGGSSAGAGGSSGHAAGGSSSGGAGGSVSGAGGGGAGGASAGSGGGSTTGGASGSGSGGGGALGCKAYKLCDSFEAANAPGTGANGPWSAVGIINGYAVVADNTQVHSGAKALHITAPATAGSGVLTETSTFPATDFWGRAWMRFKTAAGGHQVFVSVVTPTDQFRLFNILSNTKIALHDQKNDQFFTSATTVPMETWFCFEWHVTTSSVHVYLDGNQLTDLNPTAWSITNAQSLQIGYQRLSPGVSAGEMWVDDVAVDSAQIGCQ